MNALLQPGVPRREVWAWAMYDFANSGYTTVVITAVFNAYFVAVVAGGAPWATLAWTLTLAVSYAAVMVTAPIVGASKPGHLDDALAALGVQLGDDDVAALEAPYLPHALVGFE